ncbi:MAG TPA: nucleotide exchange factor GrpE [Nocardioidaceae bacterium]|nr:nucleotide exchange factor GrpE [Nocardioidaceae bacterium]
MTSGHEEAAGDGPATGPGAGVVDGSDSESGSEPGGAAADDLTAALAASQGRVAALTEDLQRLQAEYVNYKRRVDRDRDLVKQNATFSVLSALLPILDDLDRAREHGELEGGFKAIADSLERVVAAQGLVKFGRPGDEFDPRFHEALMHAHSADVTRTTCQHIISAGYSIGDRVVRPAKVTVVDPEPGTAAEAGSGAEAAPATNPDDNPGGGSHDSPDDAPGDSAD